MRVEFQRWGSGAIEVVFALDEVPREADLIHVSSLNGPSKSKRHSRAAPVVPPSAARATRRKRHSRAAPVVPPSAARG